MRGPRLRGFAARLFVAQALVILAGAATLVLVAFAIAPGIFHTHVTRAAGSLSRAVRDHVDEAFADAVLVSLGIAVAAALVAAVAVSAFLAVRLTRPLRALAGAARRIAAGGYSARVPEDGPAEVVTLAAAFNEMAEALESSERRRRALLSDVAHELRTPLATVEGYVEALADGAVAADDETWGVLSRETLRMHRLVEDLSRVSLAEERRLDLRLRRVAPASLVDAAVRAFQPTCQEKGVELVADAGGALPEVAVDEDRMGEVLANLIDNALRHTPAGGRITVSAAGRGDGVELAVADTGDGIAPEHLERVFERFFRTDRARARATGGSGIGLTIARAIVEALGGRIHAESAGVGRGARMVVRLPAARR
ncbi:MAG: ATP-binding protein [Actinomycetota bacterium]